MKCARLGCSVGRSVGGHVMSSRQLHRRRRARGGADRQTDRQTDRSREGRSRVRLSDYHHRSQSVNIRIYNCTTKSAPNHIRQQDCGPAEVGRDVGCMHALDEFVIT